MRLSIMLVNAYCNWLDFNMASDSDKKRTNMTYDLIAYRPPKNAFDQPLFHGSGVLLSRIIVIDMVIAINIGLGRVGIVPTATIGHLLQ